MYRRMLVPLDGSTLAETVCIYAKELAARMDIEVILLYVGNPSGDIQVPMELAYIDHVAETVRRQIREVQATLAPDLKPVKVTGELAVGYAADEILRHAEDKDVDLILLASHGQSGIKRWTLGSVAGKVASSTGKTVWLIKSPPEEAPYDKWPGKTFIVPLDGSELAESVLPHVEALAKQRGAEPVEVVLIRAAEPLTIPTYYAPDISGVSLNWGTIMQQESVRRKQEAKKYLAEVEKRLKEKDIAVKSVVVEGKASEEVVDAANKTPYSMVIMASHGRSGFSRLVYGSVAANILHGVIRPMFIVKPEKQ